MPSRRSGDQITRPTQGETGTKVDRKDNPIRFCGLSWSKFLWQNVQSFDIRDTKASEIADISAQDQTIHLR